MAKELKDYIGGLSSGISAYASNSQINDTSAYESQINSVKEMPTQFYDADSLMESYSAYSPAYTSYTADQLGISSDKALMNTALAGISGAISGADPTSSAINAGLGVAGSTLGLLVNRKKARVKAEELNAKATDANNIYLRNLNNNAGLVKDGTFNRAVMNLSAFGGQLDSYTKSRILTKSFKMKPRKLKYGGCGKYFAYGGDMSGDWTNNVTLVNAGQTHEKNPYGGVFVGTDAQGTPNLVEEGEVIFNDYVYSNRLKPTEKQLEEVKLDTKLKDKTYAEIAMELQKDSAIRPLDPISKNTLVDSMSKLTSIQEETRSKKAERELSRLMKSISPEEQMLMQQMAQAEPMVSEEEIPQEEQAIDENGNPRAYRDIRNQMDESLLNGEYAFGGKVNIGKDGLKINEGKIGSSLPYSSDMNGFAGYKNGRYTPAYLDWLNNLKFNGADYDLLPLLGSLYYEYFPNDRQGLTKEKAIELGQDNKRGEFHSVFEKAYTDYLNGMKKPSLVGKAETQPKNNIIERQDVVHPVEETSPVEEGELDISQNNNLPQDNILRYAPAVGSLLGLMANNEPDYSNADLIARGRRGIRDVRARTIGNYLTYNPYDINYERNKAQQLELATQRGLLNASNNRSAAMAGLLAHQGNMANIVGDAYNKALEYNNNQKATVANFNRATNKANIDALNQADQFNSKLDNYRANFFKDEATMRDSLQSQSSAAKSTALSNFFTNLGNIGVDNYANEQYNWLLSKGYLPSKEKKNGGKIRKKKRLLR